MALELNVDQDFATIVDGSEPVTVKRWNSAETISVADAWRHLSKTDEVEIGSGDYARHDVVWQLPWNPSDDGPRLGDVIVDAGGQCWTIITVERLRLGTRYKCLARNLRLAFGLDTRVDIQQADVEDFSSRPESVDWITLQAAVPARILQDRTRVSFDPGDPRRRSILRSARRRRTGLSWASRLSWTITIGWSICREPSTTWSSSPTSAGSIGCRSPRP